MFDGLILQPYDRAQIAAEFAKIGLARLDAAELNNIVDAMIATRAEYLGIDRLDANETMVIAPQLEHIRARTSDVKYAETKWRLFVPVTTETDAGAESWSYFQWDSFGMAEIIANYADDVKKVAATAKKFTAPIEGMALGYDWSWLDAQRAAKAGINMRNRKADAVRNGFENRLEQVAAIGVPALGIKGLLNGTNVPMIQAKTAAGGGNTRPWGSGATPATDKTPLEVLQDMLTMEDTILSTTKGVEKPDTLLLPLLKYRYVQQTPLYTGAGSNPEMTILKAFLSMAQYVKNVDWWHQLDTANAAGNGPRAVMYRRDPNHVHFELPMEAQELPPQAKGLVVEVNSINRFGGVVFEYPLSALYMDSI